MGLDICRFIEVKRNGQWERVICGKEYQLFCKRHEMLSQHWSQEKIDEVTEEMKSNAVTFNNGKDIAEYWLEEANEFITGLPQDAVDPDLYHDWGYSPCYITLAGLQSLCEHYETELHGELKSTLSDFASSIWSKFTKKVKEYYPEYPWGDHKIEDKFDDEYYLGMWKLNMLKEDIHYAKAITEMCYPDEYIYVNPDNIRIIYVYNR